MNEFLDNFFIELKNKNLDEELIDSLRDLIASDELSGDRIIEIIEGDYDEQQ